MKVNSNFNIKPYIKKFNFKFVITTFIFSLFFVAIYEITEFYSGDLIPKELSMWWYYFIFIILSTINNVFYNIEHKTNSNFISRILNGMLFFFCNKTVIILYYLFDNSVNNNFFNISIWFIKFSIVIILYEILFSIIAPLLKHIKQFKTSYIKIILILISVIILTTIPALEHQFYKAGTIKRYKQVTWNDFNAFPKPFSRFDASITSEIFLDFDSVKNQYSAYSAMYDSHSWKKEFGESEENYLLNHEQYHFNITEYFAQKLNYYIETSDTLSKDRLLEQLYLYRQDSDKLQDKYDDETNHSLNTDIQRKWEFQIDSMLTSFTQDSGWVTDYYSGGTVLLPSECTLYNDFSNKVGIRIIYLSKYDIYLSMGTYQKPLKNGENIKETVMRTIINDYDSLISYKHDSINYKFEAKIQTFDSTQNEISNHYYVYNNDYLIQLIAIYSNKQNNGLKEIVKSFINNFKIVNTDSYWISKVANDTIIPHRDGPSCIVRYRKEIIRNTKGPFYNSDGDLFFVYDLNNQIDSTETIDQSLILFNKRVYIPIKDSNDFIIKIPFEDLPKEDEFEVQYGCSIKKDSSEECYSFYYQSFTINPIEQNELPRNL